MLIAALGVVAALAFVLGLGALCLWALKRWGKMSLTSRTRVAVEVVQRVPLGPKTGLAVIRVGDKVMAVSVGDGGVRPLFELEEADRQRVIATSSVPTPMESSAQATASFAQFLPTAFSKHAFGKNMAQALSQSSPLTPNADLPRVSASLETAATTPVSGSSISSSSASAFAPAAFSPHEPKEIPSFLTASVKPTRSVAAPASNSEREFRAMLGGALSAATRLAVFVGAIVLAAASVTPLRAQAAPPVTQPPVVQPPAIQPPSTQATTTAGTTSQNAAIPTAAPQVNAATPATTNTPNIVGLPNGTQQLQAPAPKAPTVPKPALPAGVGATKAKVGNGASVGPNGASATRPTTKMVLDSAAASRNQRATPAQTAPVGADEALMKLMPQMDVKLGDEKDGGLRLNGTVGIVVMMGLLTLLPTLLLMMTGFTRILIVLHFLKQAMGTQSAPPAQLLAGMALLLTGFVMAPTLKDVNNKAITPWLDGKITQVEMMKTGVMPMREFMLRQTRESDLKTFIEMSRLPRPATVDDVPLHVLMSAFVASELRTAFQIGFAIYLPFIIIDAVVASVLMSMGMFMLPPAMISLPFKLLLFVLVDGWSLTISSLVQSFK